MPDDALTIERWLTLLATELGVDPVGPDDIAGLLDLARDAAHGVARPAAPLSTFLVGVAMGRGTPLTDVISKAHRALESP